MPHIMPTKFPSSIISNYLLTITTNTINKRIPTIAAIINKLISNHLLLTFIPQAFSEKREIPLLQTRFLAASRFKKPQSPPSKILRRPCRPARGRPPNAFPPAQTHTAPKALDCRPSLAQTNTLRCCETAGRCI